MLGRKRNRPDDWEDLDPSPVIHIRDLPEHTLEIDLLRTFERFGTVRDVSMIPNKGQALVEFEDIRCAETVVSRAPTESIYVANRRVKVNFSTSQRIIHRTGGPSEMDTGSGSTENTVLLLTIYNAQYPITVDVIKQICSAHGRVLRIVIFRKSQVQAMVEFETIDDACRAKKHLNGADIYSGCCTLKVEYARPRRLTVMRNDQDCWDYEAPPPGMVHMDPRGPPGNSLLGTPDNSRGQSAILGAMGGYGEMAMHDHMAGAYGGRALPVGRSMSEFDHRDMGGGVISNRYDNGSGGVSSRYGSGGLLGASNGGANWGSRGPPMQQVSIGGMNPMMGGLNQGSIGNNDMAAMGQCGTPVAMVYGLNMEKISCDRIFNLFCLYGNVIRIKFLHSKQGAAMVQMGDGVSVDRLINNLNMTSLFENRLEIQPSKQQLIMDVPQPYQLPDESPSFKDYTGSRHNRWVNPEMSSKNRVCSATKTLHFWNCPPNFEEDPIKKVLEDAGAPVPESIILFNNREKSSSGLIEWARKGDAIDALSLVNHTAIHHEGGKYPYLLKLSFSSAPIKERSGGGGGDAADGGEGGGGRGGGRRGGGFREGRGGGRGGGGGSRTSFGSDSRNERR